MSDSFGVRSVLTVSDRDYEIFRLDRLEAEFGVSRLPYSLKVLLENLVRHEGSPLVVADEVAALAGWSGGAEREIAFRPARVLMQDFTGVPAVVDLAAMRDAMAGLGGSRLDPLLPVDLVIDHSVTVDSFGTLDAFARNVEIEYARNDERYRMLRWAQHAFSNFRVVPPGTGICHQVNLEYLAQVVWVDGNGRAYPDTLVGTDSHTPMVNGLGVVGWGVGGIEAEAALLGQPVSLLTPKVIGVELIGALEPSDSGNPTAAEHTRHDCSCESVGTSGYSGHCDDHPIEGTKLWIESVTDVCVTGAIQRTTDEAPLPFVATLCP